MPSTSHPFVIASRDEYRTTHIPRDLAPDVRGQSARKWPHTATMQTNSTCPTLVVHSVRPWRIQRWPYCACVRWPPLCLHFMGWTQCLRREIWISTILHASTSHSLSRPYNHLLILLQGYRLYSTSDEQLRTWESHGPILKSEDVPWVYQGAKGTARMWAPDAVRGNDGKYYLFFPAPYERIDLMLIGVAVSDSPTGPFIPREEPIFNTDGIDPSVVRLSNGQWVLFTSGGLTGSIFVANIDPEFRHVSQKRTVTGLKEGYKEGPHVLVYRRKLLMYYALSRNGKYSIEQAGANMWKRPDWGFWDAGQAVAPFDGRTNHASVARFKGRTWIFWHRHMERYSARWSRRRVIFSPTSWLWWGKQRTIRPVVGRDNAFYIRKWER